MWIGSWVDCCEIDRVRKCLRGLGGTFAKGSENYWVRLPPHRCRNSHQRLFGGTGCLESRAETHIPPELVIDHLGISQQTLAAIPKANDAASSGALLNAEQIILMPYWGP